MFPPLAPDWGESAATAQTEKWDTSPKGRLARAPDGSGPWVPPSAVLTPHDGWSERFQSRPIDAKLLAVMHEYSLVLSLIERAEQEARQRKAKSIVRLSLRVGACSGVEPELLAQAFEIARTGTACEKAELVVQRQEAQWTCPSCGHELDPQVSLRCLPCDTAAKLTAGGELLLEQMEIEV